MDLWFSEFAIGKVWHTATGMGIPVEKWWPNRCARLDDSMEPRLGYRIALSAQHG
jgi:hypothetical protein